MVKKKRRNPTSKSHSTPVPKSSFWNNPLFIYALLSICLLIVFIARMHLLPFPLERDEGEYAYMARLMLDGFAPYTQAYNMKLPGTNVMYAILMTFFGQNTEGIHLGLALLSVCSMILMFLTSLHFVSRIQALFASLIFGLLCVSPYVLGQAAHATHFVVFFALLGSWMTCKALEDQWLKPVPWVLAGFFFALALICKQSGVFFLLFGFFGLAAYWLKSKNVKNTLIYSLSFLSGLAFPVALLFGYFFFFADFEKFWFWTVEYLKQYGSQLTLSEGIINFKAALRSVTGGYSKTGYVLFWILAAGGLLTLFRKSMPRSTRVLVSGFVLSSLLTIVPGLYFRSHYFITLAPAIALLVAVFFDQTLALVRKKWNKDATWATFLLMTGIVISGVSANKGFLFEDSVMLSSKRLYGNNPFVESLQISRYIQNNTGPYDRLAVMGSEPQICFYANRYSATGYIYTYNLMESHNYALTMQKEMADEIERSEPAYLIYVDVNLSWLRRDSSETYIFDWTRNFVDSNYVIEALMEVSPNAFSELKILKKSPEFRPTTDQVIYIYRRKEEA